MARYGQPRKLNVVSVAMLLAAIAGGYLFYVFVPVYWDAWTVDHQLLEGASRAYSLNLLTEPLRTTEIRKMLKKAQEDCIRLGHITDPNFDVSYELDGDKVTLSGEYDVVVVHPFGNYKTVLHMKRAKSANIKRVSWD